MDDHMALAAQFRVMCLDHFFDSFRKCGGNVGFSDPLFFPVFQLGTKGGDSHHCLSDLGFFPIGGLEGGGFLEKRDPSRRKSFQVWWKRAGYVGV